MRRAIGLQNEVARSSREMRGRDGERQKYSKTNGRCMLNGDAEARKRRQISINADMLVMEMEVRAAMGPDLCGLTKLLRVFMRVGRRRLAFNRLDNNGRTR